MFGAEILIGAGVYLVDLYQFRGEWFAGFAVIRDGDRVVLCTSPDGSESITIHAPAPGVYQNLPIAYYAEPHPI